MQQKIFSIRDAKAGVFYSPFYKTTHGEAERDFHSAVNDKNTTLNKYPEDFDLYYLGTYDTNEGKFESLDTPLHVKKAISCLERQVPDLREVDHLIKPNDLPRM